MTSRIEQKVDCNGATLQVCIEGREGAPWLVLIHSLGTDMRLWDGQISALGKEYRILRYDIRGHGKSSAPKGPYTMDQLADDLLGLLAHFGVARAHVVGISLGALTALAVAELNPPQIASIAVCDSRADMPAEFAQAIDERNRLIRKEGMAAIAQPMVERWITRATIAARPEIAEKIRQMVRTASVEGFASCAEAIKANRLLDRLAQIKVPSIFVAADQDAGLPVEVMRQMQQQVPGSRFEIIAGGGHLSNLDQPDAFNSVVLQFLRSLS
jgi:3-oxoadipate enol-lactonase